MKIKMLRTPGINPKIPAEVRIEGDTYDVSADEGKHLVAVGLAIEVVVEKKQPDKTTEKAK